MKLFKVILLTSCLVFTAACSNDDDNNNDQVNNPIGTDEPQGAPYKWRSVTLQDLAFFPTAPTCSEPGMKFTATAKGEFSAVDACGNKRSGMLSGGDLQSLDTVTQNISLAEAKSKLKCDKYSEGNQGYFTKLSLKTEGGANYMIVRDGTEQLCYTQPKSDSDALLQKMYVLRGNYWM